MTSGSVFGGVRHVHIPRRPAQPPSAPPRGGNPNGPPRSNAAGRPFNPAGRPFNPAGRPFNPAGKPFNPAGRPFNPADKPFNTGNAPRGRGPPQPTEPPRKPRDEEIGFRRVRLVDPDTGSLGPLTDLAQVIQSVRNRPSTPAPGTEEQAEAAGEKREKWWKKTWCVELVTHTPDPIVRAVNLSDEYRKAKEMHKKKRDGIIKEKEVQLSWHVAQGDLEHKLRKVRETLEEGERVTLAFSRKKGQNWPTPEEKEAKIEEVVGQLTDTAEEWKERVILPNGRGFVYLQSKV
ncbi:hypothetical protein PsYK624_008830 [Phanerochaete sordida]|uniref:Translation initiation factor 3 N-terminal domain-containing protein n=1 Tax=Phanerochaete sordida TaxID=48140 RepID=A0A9P3L8L4_9APHY|nr:hypothetical protein PsYK624_008830 [Phanerochaete sordida]